MLDTEEYVQRKMALDDADEYVAGVVNQHALPETVRTTGAPFGQSVYETQAEHRADLTLGVASWLLKEERP